MNDGGSAFPVAANLQADNPDSYWSQHPEPGMTLRDYFAATALTGIIASHTDSEICLPKEDKAAKWAYEYADAMLAAREPKTPADIGTPPDLRD